MKKTYLTLAALCLSTAALAQTTVGIASGQPTGTNYPMAEDIKRVCSNNTTTIYNVISDGSQDNILKISGDKSVQYGIIQTDALEYQKGIDPQMMKKIVMVFPFFSTEIHVVKKAGSNIKSLSDLAGKRVVEGPEGSGTWITVQVIKALTGLKWTALTASQPAGLDMVKNGQADVEFIVAGKPIKLLVDNTGYELVPLNHPALDTFGLYTKTMIQTGVYQAQKTAVPTYKVDNVLATFAFKNQYQKEIGELVTCIAHNIGTLQKTGHPKWRDVDPTDIERITWPSHPAAVAAIKRELKRQ